MAQVQTPKGRVSFVSVFEKKDQSQFGRPDRYTLDLLIPPNDELNAQQKAKWDKLYAAVVDLAKEKWPKADLADVQFPIQVIKSDDPYDRPEGWRKVTMWNAKIRPDVVRADLSRIEEEDGDFYSGCWAHVATTPWASNAAGKKTIGLNLGPIQKTGDGEPFGAIKIDAATVFVVEEEDELQREEQSEAGPF